MRSPCFDELLRVLDRKAPTRPTLFEFFLNDPLYDRLTNGQFRGVEAPSRQYWRRQIVAFTNAGYDYVNIRSCDFAFPGPEVRQEASRSLNEGASIADRASFEAYPWPKPEDCDYSCIEELAPELPKGSKFIVWGPGGVLENAIALVGYQNLCMMTMDDPELTRDVFDAIGSRLLKYYEISLQFDSVGAIISNDDWGFKTQPMLAPADLRKYVFPWHKRMVEAAHGAGKPAILHSCGNFDEIMDDVIDNIGYDGKHSYEDAILPVEESYERWGGRIAILGGLDLDFVCRSKPEEIRKRSEAMLKRTSQRGGYALGTGNSVPEYVPQENYFAMIAPAVEDRLPQLL